MALVLGIDSSTQSCKALLVDADEFESRKAGFTPPPPKYPTGVLAKYRKLVGSAATGAVCG